MGFYGEERERFIGKVIEAATFNQDSDEVAMLFQDGSSVVMTVDGDCCSKSWIEHFETIPDVAGAKILAVEEPGLDAWDKHDCDNKCGHDVLKVYHTRFQTDRGSITVEYRNDSNGYYGGTMNVAWKDAE